MGSCYSSNVNKKEIIYIEDLAVHNIPLDFDWRNTNRKLSLREL